MFILAADAADLIIVDQEGDAAPTYFVEHMRQNVAYNVGQSVWHHVVMTPDAHIILFERAETGPATTDYWELPPELGREIAQAFHVRPEVAYFKNLGRHCIMARPDRASYVVEEALDLGLDACG